MNAITKNRYRLTCGQEEFDCPTCGAPVYVGDTAWQEGGDNPFCSAYCAGYDPRVNQHDTRPNAKPINMPHGI